MKGSGVGPTKSVHSPKYKDLNLQSVYNESEVEVMNLMIVNLKNYSISHFLIN